jgi:type I restriction enzyme S subunit
LTEYETEFSEFPKEWEVKRLNELAKIIMGQSPPSSAYNDKGQGLPFIQGSKDFGDIYPSIKTFTTICKKIAPKDSILFSVRAPVGDINISDREICIGRGIAAIVPYNKTDLLYLYYYLTYSAFKIKRYSSGTTFESIKERDLKNFQITLPPLDERKKIVKILNTVDSIIIDTINLIENLKLLKEKTLNLLITGSIWHKEFVKTDIGRFPKEWEVKRLSEIAELQRGLSYRSSEKSKDEIPDGYLFLTLNSVKEGGGLKEDGWTWIKSDRLKERHFVREGDIVIANTEQSKDGSLIGSPAIVHFPEWYKKDKAVFSHHISKLLLKVSNLDVNFLFYYLSFVQPLARKYHTGTGVWGLNVDSWAKELPIPIPPLEEQKKIVEILSTIDNKIETETKYLDYMKKLKEKLLAALMTGKIRVNSIAIGDLR